MSWSASNLIFTLSRAPCENITWHISADSDEPIQNMKTIKKKVRSVIRNIYF